MSKKKPAATTVIVIVLPQPEHQPPHLADLHSRPEVGPLRQRWWPTEAQKRERRRAKMVERSRARFGEELQ